MFIMVAVQQKSTCLIIRRFTFPTFRQLWKVINNIPQLGASLCCKKKDAKLCFLALIALMFKFPLLWPTWFLHQLSGHRR